MKWGQLQLQSLVSKDRSGRKGALLFIDLDNFKTLNDTLGHLMGDLLLQQTAERLTACVREGDTVARLGGDEFVVILEDLSEQTIEAAEQVEVISEKILAGLSQPYSLDTHVYRSSGSIGATVFSGDNQEAEELLKQTDIAMYQAKKRAVTRCASSTIKCRMPLAPGPLLKVNCTRPLRTSNSNCITRSRWIAHDVHWVPKG